VTSPHFDETKRDSYDKTYSSLIYSSVSLFSFPPYPENTAYTKAHSIKKIKQSSNKLTKGINNLLNNLKLNIMATS
jgi:hypothetical protein